MKREREKGKRSVYMIWFHIWCQREKDFFWNVLMSYQHSSQYDIQQLGAVLTTRYCIPQECFNLVCYIRLVALYTVPFDLKCESVT